MSLKRIIPPAEDPITLAEAKLYLRVDSTADDDLITDMVSAATRQAENFTRRAFVTQTWDQIMDSPDTLIEVRRPPLISVDGIYATDTDGVESELAAATYYYVDTASEPGRVRLRTGATWPTWPEIREIAGFRIRYTCGYGGASDVPEDIKLAIRRTVASWYENREDYITGAVAANLPENAESILSDYRVIYL